MPTFKDSNGREWLIPKITLDVIDRVKEVAGANLARIDKPRDGTEYGESLMTELRMDGSLMGLVVWGLVKPQADAAKIEQAAFKSAIDGDVGDAAGALVWEALKSFFQKSRPDLFRAMTKQEQLMAAAVKKYDSLTIPTPTASSSPEKSGSTPAPEA